PEPQIINAKNFGVPQNRERIYIVGFNHNLGVTQKGRAFRSNLLFFSLKNKRISSPIPNAKAA
ncbi:MAG: DNA cytosine methyltransferase, partial [Flavobacterium macrobrachii]